MFATRGHIRSRRDVIQGLMDTVYARIEVPGVLLVSRLGHGLENKLGCAFSGLAVVIFKVHMCRHSFNYEIVNYG